MSSRYLPPTPPDADEPGPDDVTPTPLLYQHLTDRERATLTDALLRKRVYSADARYGVTTEIICQQADAIKHLITSLVAARVELHREYYS